MTTLQVRNPRTGLTDFRFETDDASAVASLARRLRKAQTEWAARPIMKRCETLQRWADAIAARQPELTDALARDTGRYLLAGAEVGLTLGRIAHWSRLAPQMLASAPEGRSSTVESVRYVLQRVPYALVGAVSPWNFPLTLALIDAIPALLAGCAVLLKPSEVTPRFVEPLRDSLRDVPELAAVLGIVMGGPETGIALIDNVDAVCFTGSVATGRRVGEQAAYRLIPAFLELGGKDPAIVTAEADLERATDAILRSAAGATGQACQSIERIYVDVSIHDRFVALLVEKARAVRLNYPDIHSGHIGPLIYAGQAATLREQLEDARRRGARIHCGGEIEELGGGLWCRPTVMTGVSHEMLVMQQESFGPLLPVMPFADTDEAVRLANDSVFGLSAAVFSRDEPAAMGIAARLNAGAVNINDGSLTSLVYDVEKQSFGVSGVGLSRMGPTGLLRFCRTRAVLIQEAAPTSLLAMDEAFASTKPAAADRT